jgi:gliding motility-associated lipoprotein GldH
MFQILGRLSMFLGMLCLMTSCDKKTVFKDNVDFENSKWLEKSLPTFKFEIKDNSQAYNLYYNIRYGESYPFYNLYVTRFLYDSTGKRLITKVLNDQILLFDAKTGKPLGSGIGDMFDNKVRIGKPYKFPYKGKYTLKIQQQMRQNPLADIVSMGFTIENKE